MILALYYALGAGLGHCQRAASLARHGRASGLDITALVSGRLAGDWLRRHPQPGLQHLLRPQPSHVSQQVSYALPKYDLLIVDVFPRGLQGELRDLIGRIPSALIARDLTPTYGELPAVQTAISQYDLIINPGDGPGLTNAVRTVRTAPWLGWDRHDLLPRAQARRVLGSRSKAPLILLPGCGTIPEIAQQRLLASRLSARGHQARFMDPREPLPAMLRLLPGVDAVIGAGGYHTVHECRATGRPLWARPRARRYDRQSHRLASRETWRALPDLDRQLQQLAPAGPVGDYDNGIHQAVRALVQLGARAASRA